MDLTHSKWIYSTHFQMLTVQEMWGLYKLLHVLYEIMISVKCNPWIMVSTW
jgi:hypothetical protein